MSAQHHLPNLAVHFSALMQQDICRHGLLRPIRFCQLNSTSFEEITWRYLLPSATSGSTSALVDCSAGSVLSALALHAAAPLLLCAPHPAHRQLSIDQHALLLSRLQQKLEGRVAIEFLVAFCDGHNGHVNTAWPACIQSCLLYCTQGQA